MGDGAPEVEITGLAYASTSVSEGTLFFCVPGFKVDGHDFAPDAVERGAAALVCERPLGLGVPEVVVDDVRATMGPVAARFFADPTSKLRVAGITGTNGKTTTAFLVRDVLEAAGLQTGLLGTVKQVVGGVEEEAVRTTGEAIDLQETFVRMRNLGDQACAMEVSSHALELGRADGITFAVKVFTNLTQDHLDFHPDMEAYYLAKRRLFDQPGPAVVNADDEYGVRLAAELGDAVTFGIDSEADYRARDIRFDVTGARVHRGHPGRGGGHDHATARPVQRVQRPGGLHGGAGDGHRGRGGGEGTGRGGSRARPLRARRGGPGLRRAGGLRAHARLTGERAARGTRGVSRAPCTWSSAPAATATRPSGR